MQPLGEGVPAAGTPGTGDAGLAGAGDPLADLLLGQGVELDGEVGHGALLRCGRRSGAQRCSR